MGLLSRPLLVTAFLMFFIHSYAYASWQSYGPIISGRWGAEPRQFGIEIGDTSTILPSLLAVLPDGKIIIADIVNNRHLVVNPDGTLYKEIKWILQKDDKGQEIYVIPEYSIGDIVVHKKDGTLLSSSAGKYYLHSASGQLLQTYTSKPTEAGDLMEEKQSDGNYKITITYPDKKYSIIVPRHSPDQIIKDSLGNLYISQRIVDKLNAGTRDEQFIQHYRVIRFNTYGKETGRLDLPQDEKKVIGTDRTVGRRWKVVAGYGRPVVSPKGDIYISKNTPDVYSILKWTWVNDPKRPD